MKLDTRMHQGMND